MESGASETDRRLAFAVLQYLKEARPAFVSDVAAWDAARAQLEKATGMQADSTEDANRFALSGMG